MGNSLEKVWEKGTDPDAMEPVKIDVEQLKRERQMLIQKVRELKKELASTSPQPSQYEGTSFHHFPGVMTIATREESLTARVQCGLALVALPQYFDVRGERIHGNDLVAFSSAIRGFKPGDQWSRPKGQLIADGRARRQRNYSDVLRADYVIQVVKNLREMEALIQAPRDLANAFSPFFLEFVAFRTRLQSEAILHLTRGRRELKLRKGHRG